MPIKVTNVIDATIEAKSAAAEFLNKYEQLEIELSDLRALNASQTNVIKAAEIERELQLSQLKDIREERDRYLRYSVELSAQLQFIVAGAARALKIAQTVSLAVSEAAARDVPDVPGTDLEQLEDIFNRLEQNAKPMQSGSYDVGKASEVNASINISKPGVDVFSVSDPDAMFVVNGQYVQYKTSMVHDPRTNQDFEIADYPLTKNEEEPEPKLNEGEICLEASENPRNLERMLTIRKPDGTEVIREYRRSKVQKEWLLFGESVIEKTEEQPSPSEASKMLSRIQL